MKQKQQMIGSMKKRMYTVILLLGLSMMLSSCSTSPESLIKKELKIVATEDFYNQDRFHFIRATFEDSTKMDFFLLKNSNAVMVRATPKQEYKGHLYIPETITHNGVSHPVTETYDYAFHQCGEISSITLPCTLTKIGYLAFCNCKSLTSITIPNSVTFIDDRAFAGCEKLTSIIIPESVTSIGKRVFANCKELTSVTILNPYLQFDYDEVFDGCEKLLRSQVIYEKQEKNEQTALDDIAGFYSNKNENEFGCLFLYYDGSYMTVGYDWPEEKGHYVIQNNEVMFAPSAITNNEDDPSKWIEVSDRAFYVLPIDNANQKVGRYTKEAFLTEKEVAEAKSEYGDDWVFMVEGDGYCTRSTLEEFKQKSAYEAY
jgi:hypothetical protein